MRQGRARRGEGRGEGDARLDKVWHGETSQNEARYVKQEKTRHVRTRLEKVKQREVVQVKGRLKFHRPGWNELG